MMKLLALLLVLSCGHEKPPTQDLGDRDGDSVPNALEVDAGMDPDLAEITGLPEVAGKLTFHAGKDEKEVQVLSFQNRPNLTEEILRLLTAREGRLGLKSPFSEWARLHVKPPSSLPLLSGESYRAWLDFSSQLPQKPSIFLEWGGKSRKLGAFASRVPVQLSGEELRGILLGTHSLRLEAAGMRFQEVREKTRRVFFHDGISSRVIYLAKELTLDETLGKLGVPDAMAIDPDQLPFLPESGTPNWWKRELPSGERVIVLAADGELKASFLSGFEKLDLRLERLNGQPPEARLLEKGKDARVFLRVRALRDLNLFKERRFKSDHCSGRQCDVGYTCDHFYRDHAGVKASPEAEYDPLEELLISSNGFPVGKGGAGAQTFKKHDQAGPYWEILLNFPRQDVSLGVATLPPKTYVTTGLVSARCDDRHETRADKRSWTTNLEAKLSFQVEAWVEKAD